MMGDLLPVEEWVEEQLWIEEQLKHLKGPQGRDSGEAEAEEGAGAPSPPATKEQSQEAPPKPDRLHFASILALACVGAKMVVQRRFAGIDSILCGAAAAAVRAGAVPPSIAAAAYEAAAKDAVMCGMLGALAALSLGVVLAGKGGESDGDGATAFACVCALSQRLI